MLLWSLGTGVSGLVHISQICEKRIRKPSEVLSVGDKVKVKVIAIKDGKLSLSIKEASDLMAKEVEEESFELPESGGGGYYFPGCFVCKY